MAIYKLIYVSIVVLLSVIGLSFNALADTEPGTPPFQIPAEALQPQNVILILADDLGVDMLAAYNEGTDFPNTPNIDRMASGGVLFRNVWATPKCSPTRATILTGRHGFRTGITGAVASTDLQALSPAETLILEVLSTYTQSPAQAMIGKWHLGNCLNGKRRGPNIAGFSHYAGSFANLVSAGKSFFAWDKTVNGQTSLVHTYATTDHVNEAITWIQQQQAQPWFLYLAFNAPHEPFHIPPHDLVSPATLAQLPQHELGLTQPAGTPCKGDDRRHCYRAMIEAMDAEIGRLLASIPLEELARTTIVFVGDNGTPKSVTRPPFSGQHAKNTLYEGGVNVPLIVSGAGVVNPNRESDALVNTTDLFATTLELATGKPTFELLPVALVHDSMSLNPILKDVPGAGQRPYAYTELFHPTQGDADQQFGHAIRNARYKLIRLTTAQRDEFYDLATDPFEQHNLLLTSMDAEQTANHAALAHQLAALRAPVENACPIVAACSACNDCVLSDDETATCNTVDTGRAFCQMPDTTAFSCLEGETIHTVRSPCTGSPNCAKRRDQQFVCAPSNPVADLSPAFDPEPDPEPTSKPEPDVEPPVETTPVPEPERQNVILILADDIGVDMLRAYDEGADFPSTPTIDRLADEGVLFRNAWATPKCSSTRATILTGRYGFRNEVMSVVYSTDLRALATEEIIIPEVLTHRSQSHEPAMIGKWHVGNCLNGQRRGPNLAGFPYFAGSFANIVGKGQSFFEWDKTINGPTSRIHTYATTDSINDAITWINDQGERPWFLYLPLHAPHQPWQVPPYELVSPSTLERLPRDAQGNIQPPGTLCEGADERICYVAMVEAMDVEIGRLLASIPSAVMAKTTVIFASDNGTPRSIIRPPFDPSHSKSTLYEGGVNVPLIVYGAGVVNPNRESAALVNTTDFFATTLELATGQSVSELLPADLVHDSMSFNPILKDIPDAAQRHYAYTEVFHPTRLSGVSQHFGYAIRNDRYKLIRLTRQQRDEFYDLAADPHEQNNLLRGQLDEVQTANHESLNHMLAALRAPVANACPIVGNCSDCNGCVVNDAAADACMSADTGLQTCRQPDDTDFSCPEGQTIYTLRCPCTGSNGSCTTRHDRQLICQ